MRSNGSFTTSVHHKCTLTGLFTNFDSFIPMMYKKVCFSFLYLVISIFVLLTYLSSLKWKIVRKPFLPMVILKHLQIVALRHFLTGFITPKTRSIRVPRKLSTSAFLSLDIMVYRSVHNLVKFLLLLTHIFPYELFSVPLVAFLVSFHLKTGFPLP